TRLHLSLSSCLQTLKAAQEYYRRVSGAPLNLRKKKEKRVRMKLSVIIACVNQFPITEEALLLVKYNSLSDNEIIVIDNGSDNSFQFDGVKIVRNEIN